MSLVKTTAASLNADLSCFHDLEAIRWYAVYVRPHHERTVERSLSGKGYEAFSPYYTTKRKRSDRTKELDVPLFPGYVFCRFDPNQRLPILKTEGIVHVVGSGNIPQPVDQYEIDSVRRIADSGLRIQPWPFLRAGQRIRIQAGPLCGVEGVLLKLKSEWTLIASVAILQRSVAVEIDQDCVVPVFS